MKYEIPENRGFLIPAEAVTDDYAVRFPWALAKEYLWTWNGLEFDSSIVGHEELLDAHDIHIDDCKAAVQLAMAADTVLKYVLDNPSLYGLKKLESEEEKP